MSEIFDILTKTVPLIVTFAVAFLAVIAPITKSDIDNKVLDVLRYIEDKILSVLFPSLKNQEAEAK